MKEFRHFLTITLLFAIVGCGFGIRKIGLKEKEILDVKRQAEISTFWANFDEAKDGGSELAKSIKDNLVQKISRAINFDEILALINENLANPITLDNLITD